MEMSGESDQLITRITIVLNTANDWQNWIFLRKDTADRHGLWPYCNPELSETEVQHLVEPIEPTLTAYHFGATKLSDLDAKKKEDYKWEYDQWGKRYTKWEKLSKAMRDFKTEISTHIDKKNIHYGRRQHPMSDLYPFVPNWRRPRPLAAES